MLNFIFAIFVVILHVTSGECAVYSQDVDETENILDVWQNFYTKRSRENPLCDSVVECIQSAYTRWTSSLGVLQKIKYAADQRRISSQIKKIQRFVRAKTYRAGAYELLVQTMCEIAEFFAPLCDTGYNFCLQKNVDGTSLVQAKITFPPCAPVDPVQLFLPDTHVSRPEANVHIVPATLWCFELLTMCYSSEIAKRFVLVSLGYYKDLCGDNNQKIRLADCPKTSLAELSFTQNVQRLPFKPFCRALEKVSAFDERVSFMKDLHTWFGHCLSDGVHKMLKLHYFAGVNKYFMCNRDWHGWHKCALFFVHAIGSFIRNILEENRIFLRVVPVVEDRGPGLHQQSLVQYDLVGEVGSKRFSVRNTKFAQFVMTGDAEAYRDGVSLFVLCPPEWVRAPGKVLDWCTLMLELRYQFSALSVYDQTMQALRSHRAEVQEYMRAQISGHPSTTHRASLDQKPLVPCERCLFLEQNNTGLFIREAKRLIIFAHQQGGIDPQFLGIVRALYWTPNDFPPCVYDMFLFSGLPSVLGGRYLEQYSRKAGRENAWRFEHTDTLYFYDLPFDIKKVVGSPYYFFKSFPQFKAGQSSRGCTGSAEVLQSDTVLVDYSRYFEGEHAFAQLMYTLSRLKELECEKKSLSLKEKREGCCVPLRDLGVFYPNAQVVVYTKKISADYLLQILQARTVAGALREQRVLERFVFSPSRTSLISSVPPPTVASVESKSHISQVSTSTTSTRTVTVAQLQRYMPPATLSSHTLPLERAKESVSFVTQDRLARCKRQL